MRNVFAWWPKQIPENYIAALKRLGRRSSQLVLKEEYYGLRAWKYKLAVEGHLTLAEQEVREAINPVGVLVLSAVLGEGPKLFKIPPGIAPQLNEIEIPLRCGEYAQPFPCVIVDTGSEYQFVLKTPQHFLVASFKEPNLVDSMSSVDLQMPIEEVLTGPAFVNYEPTDMDFAAVHRYRATLNFLLLVMTGGFTEEKQAVSPHIRRNRNLRLALPTIYKPQDISLFRQRVTTATARSEPTGARNTPHWRRAHWRRVSVGPGRVGRELRLIAACFVNKELLREGADISGSEYQASIKS